MVNLHFPYYYGTLFQNNGPRVSYFRGYTALQRKLQQSLQNVGITAHIYAVQKAHLQNQYQHWTATRGYNHSPFSVSAFISLFSFCNFISSEKNQSLLVFPHSCRPVSIASGTWRRIPWRVPIKCCTMNNLKSYVRRVIQYELSRETPAGGGERSTRSASSVHHSSLPSLIPMLIVHLIFWNKTAPF